VRVQAFLVHDDANNFGWLDASEQGSMKTWPSLFRCPPSASHVSAKQTHRINVFESGDYKLLEVRSFVIRRDQIR